MAEVKPDKKDMSILVMAASAIVATSFGFILRAFSIGDWTTAFNLTATQAGALNGVGLWPFAIAIALISLIIDKVGFKAIFFFALACHVVSTFLLLTATGYQQLFWGTFVLSLGNGAVEAAANPLIATVFREQRVRYLNYLHAGWPGGLVLGGLLSIILTAAGQTDWHIRIGLILIPMAVYAFLLLSQKFPVTERVAANVPYRDMLKDAGAIGSFLVSFLAVTAILSIPELSGPGGALSGVLTSLTAGSLSGVTVLSLIVAAIIGVLFFLYTRSVGNWLFILILLVMMPQAVTELGTANWVSALMQPVLGNNAYWVLVISSAILLVLRLFAGQILHKISPIGILTVSAGIAALAMWGFAYANGMAILGAAVLFGLGTAFFWPTTLGFVAEQFPRAGSVGINFVGAAGMLAAGTVGGTLMGNMIDKSNQDYVLENGSAYSSQLLTEPRSSMIGSIQALDSDKVAAAAPEAKAVADAATANSTKTALSEMALLPAVLFVVYLLLFFWFRSKGGYKNKLLDVTEEDMSKAPTGA